MNILGLDVRDIPEGCTPIGLLMVVDALDEDGDHVLITRDTGMDALRKMGAIELMRINQNESVKAWYAENAEDDD